MIGSTRCGKDADDVAERSLGKLIEEDLQQAAEGRPIDGSRDEQDRRRCDLLEDLGHIG